MLLYTRVVKYGVNRGTYEFLPFVLSLRELSLEFALLVIQRYQRGAALLQKAHGGLELNGDLARDEHTQVNM